MDNLKVEMISVNDCIPYENNPRNNDEAAELVANSIKEFGFRVPIILDKDNVIVAGHTRLKAALILGMNEVPVIRATDLSEEQIKAFRLADNKVAERASWDWDKLSIELDDISLNMEDFGFDDFNVDEEDFGTDFELKDGDRDPLITMSITLSDGQAEAVKEAISLMKKSKKFQEYENEFNENSNGNALFLVVDEWLQQQRRT